ADVVGSWFGPLQGKGFTPLPTGAVVGGTSETVSTASAGALTLTKIVGPPVAGSHVGSQTSVTSCPLPSKRDTLTALLGFGPPVATLIGKMTPASTVPAPRETVAT